MKVSENFLHFLAFPPHPTMSSSSWNETVFTVHQLCLWKSSASEGGCKEQRGRRPWSTEVSVVCKMNCLSLSE